MISPHVKKNRNFKFSNVLLVGDNQVLLEGVYNVLIDKKLTQSINFFFAHSPQSMMYSEIIPNFCQIDVNKDTQSIIKRYDLIISLHCKQFFSAELIMNVKCINVHPGFNPYNRGWYPHVFSIINKLPAGVTIHEMDEDLDHGPIIIQHEEPVYSCDTSKDLYDRIIELELKLFSENIESILKNSYKIFAQPQGGNINYKHDFENIKRIDLKKTYTGKDIIDLLRALTHDNYSNAYFFDADDKKIFVTIKLTKEEN